MVVYSFICSANDLEVMTNDKIWFETFCYVNALVTFIVCVAQQHRCMLSPQCYYPYDISSLSRNLFTLIY